MRKLFSRMQLCLAQTVLPLREGILELSWFLLLRAGRWRCGMFCRRVSGRRRCGRAEVRQKPGVFEKPASRCGGWRPGCFPRPASGSTRCRRGCTPSCCPRRRWGRPAGSRAGRRGRRKGRRPPRVLAFRAPRAMEVVRIKTQLRAFTLSPRDMTVFQAGLAFLLRRQGLIELQRRRDARGLRAPPRFEYSYPPPRRLERRVRPSSPFFESF